jgi:phage-related protein
VLIGEASIRIDAQTAGLKAQVNKDLNEALGGIKPSSAPIEDLGKKADGTDKNFAKLKKSVGDLFGPLSKIGSAAATAFKPLAAVSVITQLLPALVGGIVTLSGALFLAVPAGLAFGAAIGAMKLGADGAKAAFDKLNPTMTTLKKNVSDSFQKALTPAVSALIVLLPKLTSGFQAIVTAIGGVATKIATMLKSSAGVSQLQTILQATAKIIANVGAALAPFIAGLLKIGSTAIPILVQLTAGFGSAGDKFKAFADRISDTGALTQWIQDALAGFKSVGSVLGDLGTILKAVFDAISAAGGGLTGVLGGAIKAVKDFVTSASGQQTLTNLVSVIQQISGAISGALGNALKIIGPTLPGLVTALGSLVAVLTPYFATTVQILATAFAKLATFLSQNIKWVGPLAIAIGAIAVGMKVWAIATAAQVVAQGLLDAAMGTFLAEIPLAETAMLALDAAMDANPIAIIVVAIAALVAIIIVVVTHLSFFRGLWNAVWKFCSDVVTKAVDGIKSVFGSVVSWLSGAVTNVGNFFKSMGSKISAGFEAVVNFFKELPGKIGSFLAALPGIIGKALLDALKFGANAVLQGIEWILAEFVALPIQIGYGLIKLGEVILSAFTAAINAVIAWVPGAFANLVHFFDQLPGQIMGALKAFGSMIVSWAEAAWNGAWKATSNLITAIVDFVKQLPGKIISGVESLISSIGNFFKNVWNAAWRATSDGITAVVNFIRGLPQRVLDGLGDLGSLLANAGRAIVNGFIAGIKAAWGAVTSVVSGLLSKVRKLLPFSPAKEGPFSGRGWVLYSGMSIPQAMADGINAAAHKAVNAATGLAVAVNAALTSQALSVGNVAVGVPSPIADAANQAAASANSTNAAISSLAGAQGGLGNTIADALTGIQVVVSATDVNNKVTKLQNTDKRRR